MRESPRRRSGQALPRRTVIFIVRVWAEYLEETPPLWRGEIERADTREVKRFQTLEEVIEHVRENAGGSPKSTEKEVF